MIIKEIESSDSKAEIAGHILAALPDWFGLPDYHRQGIGRLLFQSLLDYARSQGYSFLQVKTVQEGHYPEYDQTNAFYKGIGFRELECFPTLWDEWNPCQILVMALSQ